MSKVNELTAIPMAELCSYDFWVSVHGGDNAEKDNISLERISRSVKLKQLRWLESGQWLEPCPKQIYHAEKI